MIQEKKKIMLNELKEKIENWSNYSETMYGYTKEDAITFLKRFQIGIYDAILKESLWFTNKINIDDLVNYEKERKKHSIFSNISEENFTIYSILQSIKEHIEKINEYPKVYNKNFHTKINNYKQEPLSEKQEKEFFKIYINTLKRNFTWKETRSIMNNYKNFNITENKDFPNNIKELQKIFIPKINNYYPKFFKKNIHLTDITILDKRIKLLQKALTKYNIKDYLSTEHSNKLDNYIKNSIKNIHTTNINKINKLLKSLTTEKNSVNLNSLLKDIPKQEKESIQKHYNFIYQNTTELEYIEETIVIINKLIKLIPKSKDKSFTLILLFNTILSSKKIVPPILTKDILKTKDEELIKIILTGIINLSKNKEA